MTWIDIIEYNEAEGRLLNLYEQCKNPDNTIDRVLKVHSLRPRTLHAHLFLYKATLHTKPNELSYRERELIGIYVSYLNGCNYCVQHHKAGLGRHLDDGELADQLYEEAIDESIKPTNLTPREVDLLLYAKKLTLNPSEMKVEDINPLRERNLSDQGILDINQLVAYFNYVNRTVNGLGVNIAGEKLGFHPVDTESGFKHH